MNGWKSCPKYRAVFDVPFLACNAAATICIVSYTLFIPNDHISVDMLQMHKHVSIKKNITPCAFHSRTAEIGVLIGKTKMSYRGMVGLG